VLPCEHLLKYIPFLVFYCWGGGCGGPAVRAGISGGSPHTCHSSPDFTSTFDVRIQLSDPQNSPSFPFSPTLAHPANDRPSNRVYLRTSKKPALCLIQPNRARCAFFQKQLAPFFVNYALFGDRDPFKGRKSPTERGDGRLHHPSGSNVQFLLSGLT